jgi:hypothetical protein
MVLILFRQGLSTSCSTFVCRERWENGASFTQVRLAIFHVSSDSAMRGMSEVAVVQHIDRRFWRRHRTTPHQQYKEMVINGSETDLTRENATR